EVLEGGILAMRTGDRRTDGSAEPETATRRAEQRHGGARATDDCACRQGTGRASQPGPGLAAARTPADGQRLAVGTGPAVYARVRDATGGPSWPWSRCWSWEGRRTPARCPTTGPSSRSTAPRQHTGSTRWRSRRTDRAS